MKALLLLAALCVFSGCVSIRANAPANQEEAAYLEKAMAQPATFKMSHADAERAWARVQYWINRFGTNKIQTATAYVIDTYNLSTLPGFYYNVSRNPETASDGQDEYTVVDHCHSCEQEGFDRNRHLLAYYIKTGEATPENLVAR